MFTMMFTTTSHGRQHARNVQLWGPRHMRSPRHNHVVYAQQQVNKGLGVLEWTGQLVPQGVLVKGRSTVGGSYPHADQCMYHPVP